MKYRFEIIYASKYMKEASAFLKKCDLGIDGIGIKETITFTSKNNLSIEAVKMTLAQAFEECDGELLRIEGGRVE